MIKLLITLQHPGVRDGAIIIWRGGGGGGSKISKVGLKIKLHPPN